MKCLTPHGRKHATDPILEAEEMANRCLADYNERVEAGKNDKTAQKLWDRGQFWLDRYNRLAGNS